MIDIILVKDPLKTIVFLFLASFTILYFEIAIPIWFIAFAVYIQHNAYYQKRYTPHTITYTKNTKFIADSCGMYVNLHDTCENYIKKIVFWEEKRLSVYTINGLLVCAFGSWFGLTFLPLRLLAVCGLWLGFICNNDFAKNLGLILLNRIKLIDFNQVLKEINMRFK